MPRLSTVPEDSTIITRIPSKSEPSLPLCTRSTPPASRRGARPPRAARPNGYATPPGGYVTPPNGYVAALNGYNGTGVNGRPLSFPPSFVAPPRSTQDLIYDGNGSKESILYPTGRHNAAGEVFGPRIRGLDVEGGGGGTVTVASSLSGIEDDEIPLYRRAWMIAIYVLVLFIVIAVATALGVVLK